MRAEVILGFVFFLVVSHQLPSVSGQWCRDGDVVPKHQVFSHGEEDDCNTCECFQGAWDCTYYQCITGPKLVDLGTFNSSSYHLFIEERNWDHARTFCQEQDGDLVVINSEAEWKFLWKAVKDNGEEEKLWMGASAASGHRGPWTWLDGRSLSTRDQMWGSFSPSHTARSCLVLSGRSQEERNWMDFPCRYDFKAVCEKPVDATSS